MGWQDGEGSLLPGLEKGLASCRDIWGQSGHCLRGCVPKTSQSAPCTSGGLAGSHASQGGGDGLGSRQQQKEARRLPGSEGQSAGHTPASQVSAPCSALPGLEFLGVPAGTHRCVYRCLCFERAVLLHTRAGKDLYGCHVSTHAEGMGMCVCPSVVNRGTPMPTPSTSWLCEPGQLLRVSELPHCSQNPGSRQGSQQQRCPSPACEAPVEMETD